MSTTHVPAAMRRLIRLRAGDCCEYCLAPESLCFHTHQVDHIAAEKHRGETVEQNLALSCVVCNQMKGSDLSSIDPQTGLIVPLFHPRQESWPEHFDLSGPLIVPLTPEGRVTANPPRSGVYYYYNPDRSANANARMSTAQLPLYQPAPGSQRLATFGRRPDVLMRLIERLGLYRALPGKIWDKLQHRGSTTYLYRIAGGQVNQSGAFTNSTDAPRTLPH